MAGPERFVGTEAGLLSDGVASIARALVALFREACLAADKRIAECLRRCGLGMQRRLSKGLS